MNRIPVSVPALGDVRFLGCETRTDNEGKPVLRDGVPVQRASILIAPPGGKREVIDVNLVQAEPVRGPEYGKAKVLNLVARPWSIDGRDGVSFSADNITVVGGMPAPQPGNDNK